MTGSGEHLLPVYALDGGVARVTAGSHWGCERVINSATLSCRWAIKATNGTLNEQYPGCLPIFAAEVPDCLAHCDNERRKCTAGAATAPSGAGQLDGQWLQTDTNKFGYKHIWRCTITTRGNQLPIVDEEGSRWTGTITGNRVVLRGPRAQPT